MRDNILFVDVKESHTEPLLLFDITAPEQLVIIKKEANDGGADYRTKIEAIDRIHIYVQPDIRKIEIFDLYQNKKLREFIGYCDNLKIGNYSQFPVLPIVLEDDAWRIEITGSQYSRIVFDETQISRILSDDDTRQKWRAITDDNMELSMVITKPKRLTIVTVYDQAFRRPQYIYRPDAVNIYCNRETYTIKIEAQNGHNILLSCLIKIRASCFIQNLSVYPDKDLILATDDYNHACIIEGKGNSSISIKSDFLKGAVELDKELVEQQRARIRKKQDKEIQKLLGIIAGEIKMELPQKIMEFQHPDNVFIAGSPDNGEETAYYEHLSGAEIEFSPIGNELVLYIKPEGQSYPEVHRFPCEKWHIIWDTNDFLGTKEYYFYSGGKLHFSVSKNRGTNIEYYADIYDYIETMHGD
jgi:hypothetical protein